MEDFDKKPSQEVKESLALAEQKLKELKGWTREFDELFDCALYEKDLAMLKEEKKYHRSCVGAAIFNIFVGIWCLASGAVCSYKAVDNALEYTTLTSQVQSLPSDQQAELDERLADLKSDIAIQTACTGAEFILAGLNAASAGKCLHNARQSQLTLDYLERRLRQKQILDTSDEAE